MFWRKRKEPTNRESQPVADPPSDNDLQRQAHAAYGGRASELKSLLRSRGRDAIAEALDVDAYMASEDLRPACLERLNDDPHGTVWCVLQRRHVGDHAGRCLWCDLVLMVVEEAEGRGDLSLRAWVRAGGPEGAPSALANKTGPGYGPNDREVREFISTIRTLGGEAWVHGVLAVRMRQEPAAVEAAWARLLVATTGALAAGLGDAMRAGDQEALATVEANMPQSALESDAARNARDVLEKATKGAVLAVILRGSLDPGSFATLFAPFAAVARL